MKFTTAAACESVVWEMRLADWPRAQNRALLNMLYNGAPPYTEQERAQNNFVTNVNFLEGTKILHDARRQFSTAFSGADNLFTVDVDHGPKWKRREWSSRITAEMNRVIKASRRFLDVRDSIFASSVLHGIGPSMWEDKYCWCPYDLGIEDVLIPTNTYTSLKNLPFFAVYRQYTGAELYQKTHGPKVDKAWNMPLVEKAIAWVDEQARQLTGAAWPEVWSPEKMAERIKQDSGLYASDAVPTIDTFELYFWNDDKKRCGWNRKIILDAWGSPGVGGVGGIIKTATPEMPDKTYLGTRGEFLYDPGERVYADNLEQIIHFQFADCSCVAPFRYHSVRSLGFLLYAVCHLQNRLRCRFNDHVFENMLQYFRVSNPQDAQRLAKVDLIDKGIIPEGLAFVQQAERWQVNEALIDRGMSLNRQTMADNSASFTQDIDLDNEHAEETATRTMAKVNATAALVGSMLGKAYNQAQFQYAEIARRLSMKNSPDPDAKRFRVACLSRGVPEEALEAARMNVQPVRVVGSGNKMMQVAMADKLMAIRGLLDPEGQKLVERIYILANSDDPSLAQQLVPDEPGISKSVHDAQASLGTLLAGLPVTPEEGMNHAEYIEVWLHGMATVISRIEQTSNMGTPQDIVGLNNIGKHIQEHIQMLSQDPEAKEKVREYSDDLNQLMNVVKGFQQRLAESQQQGAQNQANGEAAAEAAKSQAQIQAIQSNAQVKNQIASESHAQKTAQRSLEFQQKMKQQAAEHKQQIAKTDIETAANIRREEAQAQAQAANEKESAE